MQACGKFAVFQWWRGTEARGMDFGWVGGGHFKFPCSTNSHLVIQTHRFTNFKGRRPDRE
jgi:hypothetical protein